MRPITVWRDIEAPLGAVWQAASDFASHPRWMADVASIEFLGEQRRGAGTRLRVETVVGPFRTTDVITVTGWTDRRSIAVEHTGLVGGTGRFDLSPVAGATRLIWTEHLRFPLIAGGPLTAFLSRPVLTAIWRGNLARLAGRVAG
jgi:carbon monoxide dehydrogenase subunit G